jgi:hypothetical protein
MHHAKFARPGRMRNLTDLNALRRDAKSRHVRPRGYAGKKVVTTVTPAAYFAAALVWRTL